MKTYTSDQLSEILESHRLWLNGECGERANLSYANLSYADLSYSDLRDADLRDADLSDAKLNDAIGNNAEIKSIQTEKYLVTYTSEVMSIGCQQHKISDWWEFTNKRILEMDGEEALDFWKIWKPLLKQILELNK